MQRKHYSQIGILIGIVLITAFLAFLMGQLPLVDTTTQQFKTSPSPSILVDPQELPTIEAERTALAIFTQSPELALSSTPFYGEIIYHEVLRNLTEVPFPSRPCYLYAENVPENPATRVNDCGPFIATVVLSDATNTMMGLMSEAGIEGTAGIESTGLQQVDASFLAVESHLGFAITIDAISNRPLLLTAISNFVDFLMQNWDKLEYVSTNATIFIEFFGQDGSKSILTTYADLSEAYRNNLSDEELIQALGGLIEIYEPS
ncbi:MAG: hypothetical protein K8L97_03390 [Anaerolineae bacterium]|nr:hypothetical protein [Anaerolineae bacterium]